MGSFVGRSFLMIVLLLVALALILLSGILYTEQPSNDEDIKGLKTGLSQVKVAILYERVTDGGLINRSLEDVQRIVTETGADMIFRGFWRWGPYPKECSQLPDRYRAQCELAGGSYRHLEEAISAVRNVKPNLIFCGAVPAQKVRRKHELNPKTGEMLTYPETWSLALDPEKADAYFPDITNEKFQELLLSWAEEQIDCGADAIWIDMLVTQARIMEFLARDPNHPAVVDALKAAKRIIDEIHAYGRSKGRYIYVGSWWTAAKFPQETLDLDFVTVSPTIAEVLEMRFNETRWNEIIRLVRERLGNVPIFAFIDWASTTKAPLGAFSQDLTPEQQREFLKRADSFLRSKGVIFIYPVHGGYMGVDATKLSFGRYGFYDSLAPQSSKHMEL